MNKVILSGYIGQEPELKSFENGGKILTFSVATSFSDKKDDQWEKGTDWHDCQLNGTRAESLAGFLKTGTHVTIEGMNKTRKYEKDGKTIYFKFVQIQNIEFINKGANDTGQSNGGDDLPF